MDQLTSLLDPVAVATIGMLALTITQYIKGILPDGAVKYANVLAGLVAAFLYFYKPGVVPNYDEIIKIVITGFLGGAGSATGFDFLSGKKSPPFTLSSKPTPPPKLPDLSPEIKAVMESPALKDTIKSMIEAFQPPLAEVKK